MRRPPNPSTTRVARAEGHTYAAAVWALRLVQGPFVLCRPLAKPYSTDSQQTNHETGMGSQAEDMARTCHVVWKPTSECNCRWEDLFEPHPNLTVSDGSAPIMPPGASTLEVCQPFEALAQWRAVAQVRLAGVAHSTQPSARETWWAHTREAGNALSSNHPDATR